MNTNLQLPEAGIRLSMPEAAGMPWWALAFDEIDYGVLLLDADGLLRHANRSARMTLAAGTPLRRDGDRILTADPASQQDWASACRQAAAGWRSMVAIQDGGRGARLSVGPLTGPDGICGGVLVLIGRRETCDRVTLATYARLQGLTDAETRVLSALCAGLSPGEIAASHGVSEATVRAQIKSVHMKTGLRSTRELLVDLATLPPMRPSPAGGQRRHAGSASRQATGITLS